MASGFGVQVTLCGGLCSPLYPWDWKAGWRLHVTPRVLFSRLEHPQNILYHLWAMTDGTISELTFWKKSWQRRVRWAREFTFKLETPQKLVKRQNLKIHTGKGSLLGPQWASEKSPTVSTACWVDRRAWVGHGQKKDHGSSRRSWDGAPGSS